MFRHLLRLIWNRKRANLLLLTEIFFAFVVLFGVGTLLIGFGRNYLQPLGFQPAQVWRLNISPAQGERLSPLVLADVLRQVRALPGVQAVTRTSTNTPFRFITMSTMLKGANAPEVQADSYDADDQYAATLGVHLREGRWFQASDEAGQRRPAIISQDARDKLFQPGQPVLGQLVRTGEGPESEFRIVGVADGVRMGSDFGAAAPSIWLRPATHDTTGLYDATLLVRVLPGQGALLQQRLVHTVAGPTRPWTTQVYALEADRYDKLKVMLAPLLGLGLVSLFLVFNVALGLFGVLWYNISQRRAEIGLRRAMGATGGHVSRQFLSEMLVLTLLGVVPGLLLAAQFPLLGAFNVSVQVYGLAMLLATGFVFVLTALCALYPSQLAAGIQPAVALREE